MTLLESDDFAERAAVAHPRRPVLSRRWQLGGSHTNGSFDVASIERSDCFVIRFAVCTRIAAFMDE